MNSWAVAMLLVVVLATTGFGLVHSSTQSNAYRNTHPLLQKHSVTSTSSGNITQDLSAAKQPGNSVDPVKKSSGSTPEQHGYTAQPNGVSASRHLVISPSRINLSGVGTQCANFTIATSDGLPITVPPTFTGTPIAFATIGDWQQSNHGLTWPATVCKIDLMSGQGTIAISARDITNNIVVTGTLAVSVAFTPYFTATQGSVSQVSGNNGYADIVTFTFPFTIAPSAGFGNPTLRFSMEPGPSCTYGGTTSIVTNYTGQNTYALTCIMSKQQAEAYGGCPSASINGTADDRDGGFHLSYTSCYKP